MKNVKMWANTDEEAKSIINCALAHGLKYTPVDDNNYSKGGFYFHEGYLTHSGRDDRQYFEDHRFEEFHFATPVELGEKSARISDNIEENPKHSHYKKDVRHLDFIDIYRVIELWEVSSPSIQHAIKKLLVPGGRGAGKDMAKDVSEAIDSLERWKQMREEDSK